MPATKLEPFEIEIAAATLKDLKARLKKTRLPADAKNSGWTYGVDTGFIKTLTEYWLHEYDWRKHEDYLNGFAQFRTKIEGVGVHFVYEKSQKPDAPALILTHGWPDSFYRFHKAIPLLTKEFDVVVPSVPGFGFSDPVPMGNATVADLWAKLMTDVLGYKSFFAAGGDVGSLVTKQLALNHSDVVAGVHLTDVGYPTGQEDPASMTEEEKKFAAFVQKWWMAEGAYAMVHMSKPQSIAVGLNDSPSGLAAWISSMINTGADDHDIETAFGSRDELLTNIMIYWLTQTAGSSVRSYAEDAKASREQFGKPVVPSKVPAAIALFPREAQFPREWAERFV